MLELLGMVAAPERPRLPVQAARFAAKGDDAARCVVRHVDAPLTLDGGTVALRLLDLKELRRARYAARRHVAVPATLLGEAQPLRPVA